MAGAHIRDEHMHQSRDEAAPHGSFFAVEGRLLAERRLDEMSVVNRVEVQLLMEKGETKDDVMLPTSVKIGEPMEENMC